MPPLDSPPGPRYDPYYRATPRKITAHAVPYVDRFGDTIVEERIIEQPHRDPMIFQRKAAKSQQQATVVTPLTFQSPLGDPYPYHAYLPIIKKPVDSSIHKLNPHVLVIVYQGESPYNDPVQLANHLITNIQNGTKFHGGGTSSISFGLAGGAVNMVYTYPPTSTTYWGYINTNAVYQQFNICPRVASGEVDEVWIYTDGKVGGHIYSSNEFVVNGPAWSFLAGTSIDPPNCGRQMNTMFLNFDRGDGEELESWGHSAEYSWILPASSGGQACDFAIPSGYSYWGLWGECIGKYDAAFGFIARPNTDNGGIGMCGDVHNPPNIPVGWLINYDYHETQTYPSHCTDWQWGATNTVPISCTTWGCTQVGYLVWWMQNVPGLNNNSHDRTGDLRPNWWNFRLVP
jgi:hypothetical protein